MQHQVTPWFSGLCPRYRRARDDLHWRCLQEPGGVLSKSVDMTFDASVSRASIEHIWSLWTARPNNILVPGHDLPMVLDGGEPRYLGTREAAIRAWFGEDLNQTTVISIGTQ